MIPQYVAAALVSENKVLCHPASSTRSRRARPEDHVSMGNAAGLKCWTVLGNVEQRLAIELLAAAQGVEFLAPLEPGAGARAAHDFVRSVSPTVMEDRTLAPDIERIAEAIRSGELVAAVEAEVGELA
jgi:histidine ammonia-lyase